MAERDGKWISLKSKNRNMDGLQSWVRTKAKGFDDYKKAMDLKANASNNTVYADSEILPTGMVTLFLKDKKLNWSKVVDGTTSATEWKGLHEVSETVHLYNPSNGWLQNCNSTHTQLLAQKVQKRKIILHGA
jgi:acyl-homoserine lactone acylase PvdQ